jgi:short-subunit dehydrogenase
LKRRIQISKHALHGFFDSLRAEVHDQGVDILLICPGFIQTDISHRALVGDGEVHGSMDDAQEQGMTPDVFAKKMIVSMGKKKEEVCIGGKETYGVLIKRFFPRWFSKMIRNVTVTWACRVLLHRNKFSSLQSCFRIRRHRCKSHEEMENV